MADDTVVIPVQVGLRSYSKANACNAETKSSQNALPAMERNVSLVILGSSREPNKLGHFTRRPSFV